MRRNYKMKLKEFLKKENLKLNFSDKQLNIDIGTDLNNHRTETRDGNTIHIWDYPDNTGVLILDETQKLVSQLSGWNTGFIEGGISYNEEGDKININ